MKFNVPSDFCDLATDAKTEVLQSAEAALEDKQEVYFQDKRFTNYDELKRFLGDRCKEIGTENDWPGERLDN